MHTHKFESATTHTGRRRERERKSQHVCLIMRKKSFLKIQKYPIKCQIKNSKYLIDEWIKIKMFSIKLTCEVIVKV